VWTTFILLIKCRAKKSICNLKKSWRHGCGITIEQRPCFYLNIRQYFPSRFAITAFSLNTKVSARLLGLEILTKSAPIIKASKMLAARAWKTNSLLQDDAVVDVLTGATNFVRHFALVLPHTTQYSRAATGLICKQDEKL